MYPGSSDRSRFSFRASRRKLALATFTLAIGITGALLWATGNAALTTMAVEAESGNGTPNAQSVSDPQASGGMAVRFAAAGNPGSGYSCDQTGIQKLVNSVSQANVDANMRSLVQDDTKPTPNQSVSRHITGPGNKQKTTWMKQKLAGYGLTDRSQTFNADGITGLVNPIGRINGTQATNLFAVGGHIDSQSEKPGTLAPGADDDASGVAATIEAARVLYDFRSCLKASVDFIGFNDEEESMVGSETYVKKIDKTFKGLFNMDMIGTHQNGTDCIVNHYNSSRDKAMADKLHEVNTKYGIGMKSSIDTYDSFDVDSANFWDANQPSSYSAECKFSPNYHRSTDVIDSSISMSQITKMTKMIVGSVAEMGMQ